MSSLDLGVRYTEAMSVSGLILHLLLATRVPTPPPAKEPLPPRVMEILQYLKSVAPSSPEAAARDRLGKPIDPAVFFGFISSKGLLFSDVLPGAPGMVGLDQLRKELKSQRGLVYRYLVGLTVDIAGSTDLSLVSFETHNGVISVSLATFVLTFSKEEKALRLQEVKSTDPGGD
jgi:hypothetical protein